MTVLKLVFVCVCVCVDVFECRLENQYLIHTELPLCWGGILGTASAIIGSKCINILKIIVTIFGITL